MAQLAVSLAGAAVGSLVGAPQLGYIAGTVLGSILFPTELPDQFKEGPRLGDLSVTASTYGQAIPKMYGTVRVGGNCIWATPLDEKRNVDSVTSGGKGGSSQTSTTTTYSYYATFALAFCEGVAEDVIRIWADGKLIYDKSGTGSVVRKPGLKFRFYDGSETQLPDSLIEADKGANNVPAYRGMVYIVFDELPLADFGNRRPNITAEIAMASTQSYPIARHDFNATITTTGAAMLAYDIDRKLLYLQGIDGSSNKYITRTVIPSMSNDMIMSATDIWTNYGDTAKIATHEFEPFLVDRGDNGILCIFESSTIDAIVRLDANSLQISHEFGLDEGAVIATNTTTVFDHIVNGAYIEIKGDIEPKGIFILTGNSTVGKGNSIGVLNASDLTYIWGSGQNLSQTGTAVHQVMQTQQYFGKTDVRIIAHEVDAVYLYSMAVAENAVYDTAKSVSQGIDEPALLATITATEMNAASGIAHTITGISITDAKSSFAYDPDNDSLIGHMEWTTSGGVAHYLMSIDATDGSINWVEFLSTSTAPQGQGGYLGDLSKSQEFIFGLDTDTWYRVDKNTGDIIETFDLNDWFATNTEGTYNVAVDFDYMALIRYDAGNPETEGGIMYLDRASGNGATLASIVTSLSADAGLDASEIDVTDLTGTTVLGYMVSRPTTVRGALEPLAASYFFDAIESDYVIDYIDRGGASVSTITQDDLGAVADNEFWVQERGQEQELPMRFTVGYMDYERDYQQGTQTVKRAESPFAVMYSKNEITTEVPIVLDDSEAKQIAEKLLYNSWVQRDRYNTVLSWEYLKLDPADIVTVNLDDGTSYKVRLASIDLGANLSMRVNALAEETASYSSTAAAENNFTASTIENSSINTYLKIHNVPLLADTHDQGRIRSVLYAQAGPMISGDTWTGATLYTSTDKVTWQPSTRLNNSLTYGSVAGTFAAPSDVFAVDTTNTLTIWPTVGGANLSSITYAQLLAGQLNMMIIGSEVVNFQNVTDNGDGSYTLDTFLRGRRGTDPNASSHATGEYFYLIDDTNAEGFTIPTGNINSAMYFRAVTDGRTLEESAIITLTPTGEDLKPYAPINATRTDDSPASGDITIGWDRRTRINGSGVGTLPLNEDSESYEVDILDGTGGSVLRTLSSTTESVEYDSADITTDFGTPPDPLYVRIYQKSAQVGRGQSYEHELFA